MTYTVHWRDRNGYETKSSYKTREQAEAKRAELAQTPATGVRITYKKSLLESQSDYQRKLNSL